jgi:hypothetical protein
MDGLSTFNAEKKQNDKDNSISYFDDAEPSPPYLVIAILGR